MEYIPATTVAGCEKQLAIVTELTATLLVPQNTS